MSWLAKQEVTYDKYRFGAMTILITIQSCYGGIACYLSIIHDLFILVAIAAFLTMGANAMFIAQAKAKVCLIGFYASIIINTLIIILGLFMLM